MCSEETLTNKDQCVVDVELVIPPTINIKPAVYLQTNAGRVDSGTTAQFAIFMVASESSGYVFIKV